MVENQFYMQNLLLHTAARRGLRIRRDGFASLPDVLALLNCPEAAVEQIVASSVKHVAPRFELAQQVFPGWIRATGRHKGLIEQRVSVYAAQLQ